MRSSAWWGGPALSLLPQNRSPVGSAELQLNENIRGLMRNVSDWERVASVAAGAALLMLAVRRPNARRLAGLTGVSLLTRGVSGYCPVNAALGRNSVRSDTRVA